VGKVPSNGGHGHGTMPPMSGNATQKVPLGGTVSGSNRSSSAFSAMSYTMESPCAGGSDTASAPRLPTGMVYAEMLPVMKPSPARISPPMIIDFAFMIFFPCIPVCSLNQEGVNTHAPSRHWRAFKERFQHAQLWARFKRCL